MTFVIAGFNSVMGFQAPYEILNERIFIPYIRLQDVFLQPAFTIMQKRVTGIAGYLLYLGLYCFLGSGPEGHEVL